ncbi:sensor histidine kinase [Paenibacillus beijingensis]|uniref:HAMP domain-containing protein n=1 Tax=Paenibacillus beijingensis TaxID=1126833 RepID=A0A0D5NJQ2_9BACL|nr:histidine kinase [Paenibacillus beijingensis]AJY75604.1 hypothetical protein VN24_14865 [Paenibacillus beijingensis]
MKFHSVFKRAAGGLFFVYAYIIQSLFRKMLFSLFAIITITVFTLGLYNYIHTSSDIMKREMQNMEKLSDQSASKLETQMANIKSTAWNYFADPDFQRFVITLGSNPDTYNFYSGNFIQFATDHPEVESFLVSQLEGNRLIEGNIKSSDVVDFQELKNAAISNNGKGAWVSSIAFDQQTRKEVNTLTFIQAVKQTTLLSDFPIVGVIMVQLSHSYLSQWLNEIGVQGKVSFLLADAVSGQVRISADPAFIGTRIEGLQDLEAPHKIVADQSQSGGREDKELLFVSQPLANTSWVLVGIVEARSLLTEVNALARDTIYIGLICLLGSMLIASVLSSRILIPLKELKKGILAVEKGDYNILLPVRTKDETGYIIHRFNQMASEIKALILKVYEVDLLRKEAEIKSLQSQINPHFLYNTLGIIDSLASLHDDERISLISRSLAKMFRYNISAGRMLTLQAELRQIELYLYIQQQRYGDRFKYAIEADEHVLDIQIPKLLLQPLVENCFIHAFDRMSSRSELRIRARSLSDKQICISVWNNGPVVEASRLDELQAMLSQGVAQRHAFKSSSSIGLLNVQHRIKLLYGNEYGLTIQSEPGKGTEVVIHLRRISEEEQMHEAANYG